jgi:hypothetical protein
MAEGDRLWPPLARGDTNGAIQTDLGPRGRARLFAGQQTEAAIGVAVLNHMPETGRPDSVRSSMKFA